MTTTPAKSNELKVIRFYSASVPAVWDAWSDPDQAKHWWGPRGFTLTTHSKDLRVGGRWHYTMHGPDGADYVNKTKYLEVEKHRKMVYDHGGNDERRPLFRVTVLFKALDGGTLMDMTMTLPTAEDAQQTKKFIRKAGGDGTWDRLAEYLAKRSSGKEIFVINQTFEAPADTIFEMWAAPDLSARWAPPNGHGGLSIQGQPEHRALQKPRSLAYTRRFRDEKGGGARSPGAPAWPEMILTTVTLTEESPERTRVTVESEPQGKASSEDIEAFAMARAGMAGDWAESFDRLENELAARRKG